MDGRGTLTAQRARIAELERENARLRRELEFLKKHPSIAQGIRGETLISAAIGAATTSYAASFDLETRDGTRVEIKLSKLNVPNSAAPTRRWNWGKPLGWLDKGKDYHYLLLLGEKDERYPEDSLDDSPYICFLVPIAAVSNLMDKGVTVGGMIQLTSNLAKLRRKSSPPELLGFQQSFASLERLLNGSRPEALPAARA